MGILNSTYQDPTGDVNEVAARVDAFGAFEINCSKCITSAYVHVFKGKGFNLDLNEEDYSAQLAKTINKHIGPDFNLSAHVEEKLIDKKALSGKGKAKAARPIDITLSGGFQNRKLLRYIVEAKVIIVEKLFKRAVNALIEEYIHEGMDRFTTGVFGDSLGCMLGYLLNGKCEQAVQLINVKLIEKSRSLEQLGLEQPLAEFKSLYASNHKRPEKLKHFFLEFS